MSSSVNGFASKNIYLNRNVHDFIIFPRTIFGILTFLGVLSSNDKFNPKVLTKSLGVSPFLFCASSSAPFSNSFLANDTYLCRTATWRAVPLSVKILMLIFGWAMRVWKMLVALSTIASCNGVYWSREITLGLALFMRRNSTISKLFSWMAQWRAALPQLPSSFVR